MTIDIDAIEARANAATPGPWDETLEAAEPTEADVVFMSCARQDVPALCAELRETRAALERARALLSKLGDGLDDYWAYCNPDVLAELAAALGSGGEARP